MGDTIRTLTTYHATDSPGKESSYLDKLKQQNSIDLGNIDNRLDTFKKWPNNKLSPKVLADAGFYYFDYQDVVRCAFCNVEGHHWTEIDDPMADHKKWRPNCPFVQKHINNNNSSSGQIAVDTCGKHDQLSEPKIAKDEVPKVWGASVGKGPLHTDFVSKERRMETFKQWPKCMKQKPADLAEAGFYYLGVGDQTICFYCGGGLKDWEESDDPWEQHAFWFPKCNHVLLKKGQDFIDQVVSKKNEEERSIDEPGSSGINNSAQTTTTSSKQTTEETKDTLNGGDQDANTIPICKICYVNQVNVMFLPCGHIVSCVDCAEALKQCPICRKEIDFVARGFF